MERRGGGGGGGGGGGRNLVIYCMRDCPRLGGDTIHDEHCKVSVRRVWSACYLPSSNLLFCGYEVIVV